MTRGMNGNTHLWAFRQERWAIYIWRILSVHSGPTHLRGSITEFRIDSSTLMDAQCGLLRFFPASRRSGHSLRLSSGGKAFLQPFLEQLRVGECWSTWSEESQWVSGVLCAVWYGSCARGENAGVH